MTEDVGPGKPSQKTRSLASISSAAAVALAFCLCQVMETGVIGDDGFLEWPRYMGWPFDLYNQWNPLQLTCNVTCGCVMVACVAATVTRCELMLRRSPRFSVADLFVVVTVCALTAALMGLERDYMAKAFASRTLYGLNINPAYHPLYLRCPIVFGAGCTVYSALCIGRAVIVRSMSCITKSSIEAG